MNKRRFALALLTVVAAILLTWTVLPGPSAVRAEEAPVAKPDNSVPEKQRPWRGKALLVTGVLGAGAVAAGFLGKNPRKTR